MHCVLPMAKDCQGRLFTACQAGQAELNALASALGVRLHIYDAAGPGEAWEKPVGDLSGTEYMRCTILSHSSHFDVVYDSK